MWLDLTVTVHIPLCYCMYHCVNACFTVSPMSLHVSPCHCISKYHGASSTIRMWHAVTVRSLCESLCNTVSLHVLLSVYVSLSLCYYASACMIVHINVTVHATAYVTVFVSLCHGDVLLMCLSLCHYVCEWLSEWLSEWVTNQPQTYLYTPTSVLKPAHSFHS